MGPRIEPQPADTIESLRQQLADMTNDRDNWQHQATEVENSLSECQAREKVLREMVGRWMGDEGWGMLDMETVDAIDAESDFTALDAYLRENGWRQCAKGQRTTQWCGAKEAAIKQAKREALLEASKLCESMSEDETWAYIKCSEAIDRMAEELK